MKREAIDALFTADYLQRIFPPSRSDEFFEALFGDAGEGAYDISLAYRGCNRDSIELELQLKERPGHCLACNLTQGLPTVFSRHPVIDLRGLVQQVDSDLNGEVRCVDWSLGHTQQKSRGLHAIPLKIALAA